MIDLTKRERWLMAKAFFDGWEHAQIYTNDPQQKDVDGWLNSDACDGATVSEVLAKAAPEADRIEELEARDD